MNSDSLINLSILDPPKYGWTVHGGIKDICPPHDRARRRSTQLYFADKHLKNEALRVDSSCRIGATTSSDFKECKDISKDISSETHIKEDKNAMTNDDTAGETTSLPSPSAKEDKLFNQIVWKLGPQYDVSLRSIPRKKKKISRSKMTITAIHAVNDRGAIDVNVYHRGVADAEPRYKESGVLCCDVSRSDTNHRWEALDTKCKVTIRFPLAEPEESIDEETKNESMHRLSVDRDNRFDNRFDNRKEQYMQIIKEVPYFVGRIEWDLIDPRTPTPMVYASYIGVEFGLSFCQTLDLARSIQEQIDAFVRQNIKYKVPIASFEPLNPKGIGKLEPPEYSKPTLLRGGHCASNVREASMKQSNPVIPIPITPTTSLVSEQKSTTKKTQQNKKLVVAKPTKCAVIKKKVHSSTPPSKPETKCEPIQTKTFENLPTRLALDTDTDYVNPLHCFVRSDLLELIQVKGEERDRFQGQVGLQCVFCANDPPNLRSKMAQIFPAKLDHLYRKVCIWQREHFTGDKSNQPCPMIPQEIRNLYKMKKEESNRRGRVSYWKQSALSLGLRDSKIKDRSGIVFIGGQISK
jgi:hypothetical protein